MLFHAVNDGSFPLERVCFAHRKCPNTQYFGLRFWRQIIFLFDSFQNKSKVETSKLNIVLISNMFLLKLFYNKVSGMNTVIVSIKNLQDFSHGKIVINLTNSQNKTKL